MGSSIGYFSLICWREVWDLHYLVRAIWGNLLLWHSSVGVCSTQESVLSPLMWKFAQLIVFMVTLLMTLSAQSRCECSTGSCVGCSAAGRKDPWYFCFTHFSDVAWIKTAKSGIFPFLWMFSFRCLNKDFKVFVPAPYRPPVAVNPHQWERD